jgi:hypothetical protein
MHYITEGPKGGWRNIKDYKDPTVPNFYVTGKQGICGTDNLLRRVGQRKRPRLNQKGLSSSASG